LRSTTRIKPGGVCGPDWRSGRARFRFRLTAGGGAALLLITLGAGPATSQGAADPVRKTVEAAQDALKEKRAAEMALASDIKALAAERERINQSLVETAHLIQASEEKLSSIEERMGELEAQEKLLRGSLSERHSSIAKLLGAMQRMGRDPPPVMITRREDALVMVRSAMMLAVAFPKLRSQAMALASRLEDLARVMGEIRSESEKLKAETQKLTDSRVRISALMESKKQSLADRQGEFDKVRREADEIARNVKDLNELIKDVSDLVVRKTGQPMRDRAPAAAPPPLKPAIGETSETRTAVLVPPPSPVPPAASQPVPGAILEPVSAPGRVPNAGRMTPAMPFDQAKGRTPLPVRGKRILSFGDKAQTNKANGIIVETRAGAQVVSPLDGWVVFAGVFRSYGQILIINGGDGYHMLLAGLSQIDAQLGQFVLSGEPVGLMGGGAQTAKAKAQQPAPLLYIELRKNDRPIDPDPWWAKDGTQKVQG